MKLFTQPIKFCIVVATVTLGIDLFWHTFATHPMESFDYFTVKWLLAFFVATVFINRPNVVIGAKANYFRNAAFAGVFSFLMSFYYRWWEFAMGAPLGSRAPEINFIAPSHMILFVIVWFLAHASFFFVGLWVANKVIKKA
ncbi:hypothetical protein A2524_01615 [Candidatus Wolfebacteria bacterium RIFOXYD12_FULL_48_21]|uniref:Uncharacterized protein n=1 Tax=Candidatus Wolfebacteria bacterium RIFOXYD1_FULL_48_65 TaxID=1802561 RepID=A0A1F8DZM8_9BACT|nr:MAG: hypothetical protein A2610_03590 [Candidatus Wolfebacteria bacterium RIFOXYD1_FULL_48_65]OGM94497.1 MAG: hypothetical protein A2524_01615 [Candidatus Wolfebacteria bacterium RIFOXYD12_FULL_48_21]OGM96683.1 MAG: hypothetical protein A2532_03960 [Candidatus Wolfebacteria bacterium RIFOXYD2_FULL_48_11]